MDYVVISLAVTDVEKIYLVSVFICKSTKLGLIKISICSSLFQKKISSLREFILFLHDPGEISDCVQLRMCAIHGFDAWGTIYGKILESDNKRNLKKITFPVYTPRPAESIRNMQWCPMRKSNLLRENKQIFNFSESVQCVPFNIQQP